MLPIALIHKGVRVSWLSCTLRKSLDNICHSATITVADLGELVPHERVEITWKDELLSTMLVDSVIFQANSVARRYTLALRSPARDIVDSRWDEDYSGTLEQVASKVASQFGITVRLDEGATSKKIDAFSVEAESAWDRLVAQARAQGLVFTSLPDGHLVLTKITDGKALSISQRAITQIRTHLDGARQFRSYLGRSSTSESTAINVSITDEQCANSRTMAFNFFGHGDADAVRRRLQSEMEMRRSVECVLRVSDWEHDGKVWDVNTPVMLDYQGLQARLLLSAVTFSADEKELRAEITLTNKEAFL